MENKELQRHDLSQDELGQVSAGTSEDPSFGPKKLYMYWFLNCKHCGYSDTFRSEPSGPQPADMPKCCPNCHMDIIPTFTIM